MGLFKDISFRFKIPFYIIIVTTFIFSLSGGILLKHLYNIREEDLKGEIFSVSQVIYFAASKDTSFFIGELELPYTIYHLKEIEGFFRVVDTQNEGDQIPNELLFQFTFPKKGLYGLLPSSEALRIFKTPYASYVSLKRGKEIIVICVPPTIIRSFIRNTKRDFIMLYFLAILSMLIVSIVISDSLSRRLKGIEDAIIQLGNERFEARVLDAAGDEIGSIGRRLNDIAGLLSELKRKSQKASLALDTIELPFALVKADGAFEPNKNFIETFGSGSNKIFEVLEKVDSLEHSGIVEALRAKKRTNIFVSSPENGARYNFFVLPVEDIEFSGLCFGMPWWKSSENEIRENSILAIELSKKISGALQVIEAFSDELKGELKDAELLQRLTTINERARFIDEIMKRIELFANLKTLDIVDLELSTEINSVISELDEGCKVRVSVEIPKNIFVKADQKLFRLAIREIVENACYATRKAGEIFIRAAEGENRIIISIVDTGEGIDTEKIGQIFHPLYSGWGKVGMGLPTVEKIMSLHNGLIEFTGLKGKGVTVRLVFPKS